VYAIVLRNRTTGGADLADAAGTGFLVAAGLAAASAVVGLVPAVVIRRYGSHRESPRTPPRAGEDLDLVPTV
jgi:ABC-type spermidine/putrescine transport system permease subunit II